MAPAAQESNADMVSLLNAVASCTEFVLDSKEFAKSEGIARSDNALTKFKRILKTNGYVYELKRVSKIEGEGLGEGAVTKTPTKTPTKTATPRKPKAKGLPVQKKRKLADDVDGDEEGVITAKEVEDDGEAAGEIKNEEEAAGKGDK